MLANRQIEPGKCYVNENDRRARQVHSVDRQTVVFSHYDMETGRLCGSPNKRCTRHELIHWADREATRREAGSLQRQEQEALFRLQPSPTDRPPHLEDSLSVLQDEVRRLSFKG